MSDFVFTLLLCFLIIFSCLSFGSVTILPLTIVETIAGFAVLLWLLEMAYKRKLVFLKTGLFLPALLFLGLAIFQLIPLPISFLRVVSFNTVYLYEKLIPDNIRPVFLPLSIHPDMTLAELFKLFTYLGIFFLIINKVKKISQIAFLINLIIFFGMFISIFGLIIKFRYPASSSFGPFVYRNNFAGYINMIIPLSVGYFLINMHFPRRLIYIFASAIMTLALFLSLSRGGVLIYISVLLLIFLLSRLKETLKERAPVLIIWFLLILLLFIFFLKAGVVWNRLATLFKRESFVVLGHGYSWLDVLRIWRDFPIFGTGLGTFGSISAMYKSLSGQGLYVYAHNDYLQLLSEAGLAGFIIAAIFFGLYLFSTIKLWLKRREPYVVCLALGGICSILGMLIYSLLDFNLHIPAVALLFFIIMGLVYRIILLERKDEAR